MAFQASADLGAEPAESCLILKDGEPAGFVTSTCLSPTLGRWIGLANVHRDDAAAGSSIQIKARSGALINAEVVKPPFYDPGNTRQEM